MAKHHAVLRPGSRLWPAFCFLRDRGDQGATSLELAESMAAIGFRDLNISVTAADLRKTVALYGYEMLPAVYEGKRGDGPSARKLYRYRLVRLGTRPAVVDQEPTPAAEPAKAMAMATHQPATVPERHDLFGDSRRVKPS